MSGIRNEPRRSARSRPNHPTAQSPSYFFAKLKKIVLLCKMRITHRPAAPCIRVPLAAPSRPRQHFLHELPESEGEASPRPAIIQGQTCPARISTVFVAPKRTPLKLPPLPALRHRGLLPNRASSPSGECQTGATCGACSRSTTISNHRTPTPQNLTFILFL